LDLFGLPLRNKSLIFVISCSVGVLKQIEIDPWLNTISGDKPPEIDVAGNWHDAQESSYFGWGVGYPRQDN